MQVYLSEREEAKTAKAKEERLERETLWDKMLHRIRPEDYEETPAFTPNSEPLCSLFRCRSESAYIRQSRPDFDFGVQVKFITSF